MLLVTECPGELACAVIVTSLLMMTLLTIVLTLLTLLSAGHSRQQVSQLGPELRLAPLEDGAVTIADHGQAHHHSLVLDTPQQHPDDVSRITQ